MRTLTRLVAALIGLALFLGGLLLALEVLLTAARSNPVIVPYDRWLRYGRMHAWNTPSVLWTGLGLLLGGLLLLLLTVRRRKPLAVAGADRGAMSVSFARKPLEQAVGRLAERSAGVDGVRVHVGKRTTQVSGASLATDLPRTTEVLQSRLSDGLERLPLRSTPDVDVRLRKAGA